MAWRALGEHVRVVPEAGRDQPRLHVHDGLRSRSAAGRQRLAHPSEHRVILLRQNQWQSSETCHIRRLVTLGATGEEASNEIVDFVAGLVHTRARRGRA